MSFYYTDRSRGKIEQAHPHIRRWLYELIKYFDVTIVDTYRGEMRHEYYLSQGYTRAKFGESGHNYEESYAVDMVPADKLWQSSPLEFTKMASIALYVAKKMHLQIKWGGLFVVKRDGKLTHFFDGAHFELANWRELEAIKNGK